MPTSLRGFSEIYAMALMALFLSFSIVVIAMYAGKAVSVERRLLHYAAYSPRLSLYVDNQGDLCFNTTDKNINSIIIDNGKIIYKIYIDTYNTSKCIPLDYSTPISVVVNTKYGPYLYSPANDPLYAGCAPRIYVFQPKTLTKYLRKCRQAAATNASLPDNYLDPVFSWYLGFPKADKYRGLTPKQINYLSQFNAKEGDNIGYYYGPGAQISWGRTFDEARGLFIAAGGRESTQAYTFYLCRYFRYLPHRDEVCVPRIIRGKVEGYDPDYGKAYLLKIPLNLAAAARFPGFWLLVGNGSTIAMAARGNIGLARLYAEASIIMDNGSVIPLIWGPFDRCYTHSVLINGWNITLTCRFIQLLTRNIPVISAVDPTHSVALYIPDSQSPSGTTDGDLGFKVRALPISYIDVAVRIYRLGGVPEHVRGVVSSRIAVFSERSDTNVKYISKTAVVGSYPLISEPPAYVAPLNITISKFKN